MPQAHPSKDKEQTETLGLRAQGRVSQGPETHSLKMSASGELAPLPVSVVGPVPKVSAHLVPRYKSTSSCGRAKFVFLLGKGS